jgi:hypothetical protein
MDAEHDLQRRPQLMKSADHFSFKQKLELLSTQLYRDRYGKNQTIFNPQSSFIIPFEFLMNFVHENFVWFIFVLI